MRAECGSCSSRRCTRAPARPSLGSFVAELERALGAARPRARSALSSTAGRPRPPRATGTRRRAHGARVPPGRRLRPFPRAGRPARRRSAGRAPARRHRTRPGRRERAPRAGSSRSDPAHGRGVRARSIAVSAWLRARLAAGRAGGRRRRAEVIDCGVDLERFALRDVAAARAEVGWSPEGTAFLCVGLLERAQERAPARAAPSSNGARASSSSSATARCGRRSRDAPVSASSAPVDARARAGVDGGRRRRLPAEPRRALRPRRRSRRMASGRPVVATRVGGPPEFVTAMAAGVLVDPYDEDALGARARRGGAAPAPERRGAGRRRAHDVKRQAERVEALLASSLPRSASLSSTSGRTASSSPASRAASSAAVALAHLLRLDALLQPVVPGYEQPLDPRACIVRCRHAGSRRRACALGQRPAGTIPRRWSRSSQSCRS